MHQAAATNIFCILLPAPMPPFAHMGTSFSDCGSPLRFLLPGRSGEHGIFGIIKKECRPRCICFFPVKDSADRTRPFCVCTFSSIVCKFNYYLYIFSVIQKRAFLRKKPSFSLLQAARSRPCMPFSSAPCRVRLLKMMAAPFFRLPAGGRAAI